MESSSTPAFNGNLRSLESSPEIEAADKSLEGEAIEGYTVCL